MNVPSVRKVFGSTPDTRGAYPSLLNMENGRVRILSNRWCPRIKLCHLRNFMHDTMNNQGIDPPPYPPTGSTPPHGINLPTTGLIPQHGIDPPITGPLLNLVWNTGYKLVFLYA